MCGRFFLHSGADRLQALLKLAAAEDRGRNVPARYNIAPTQQVLFAADLAADGSAGAPSPGSRRRLLEGRWWLVPHWARELPKYALFNARSEDARSKPSFRDAFKTHRCLIPADGYYEWCKAGDGGKDPYCIYLPDRRPFAFAGLWAYNAALDVLSCTILTAAAAPAIAGLHARMPIVLAERCFDAWTDPATDADSAAGLLADNLGDELISHRVDRRVNASRAQGADLIEPVDAA